MASTEDTSGLWDESLFLLVRAAVVEGNAAIDSLDASRYLPHYLGWPTLGRFSDSGLPHLSSHPLERGPIDYTQVFGEEGSELTRLSYQDLPSFGELFAYARGRSDLIQRLLPVESSIRTELEERMLKLSVAWLATRIIDRVRHLGLDCEHNTILTLYRELEAGVFEERLAVDLMVPLLCATSSVVGKLEIAPDVSIEALDDETQLARANLHYLSPVVDALRGAATHAIVVSGTVLHNQNQWSGLPPPDSTAMDTVERVFEGLRIASGSSIGYAEVFFRPLGWARRWKAHLPPLEPGMSVRRYRGDLDNYGWLRRPTELTHETFHAAGDISEQLSRASERTRLASRRLSLAMMRDSDEDSVIDACVGIEALLGDRDSQSEITFKLALRCAAILAMEPSLLDPSRVFRAARQAYRYRSNVVHGAASVGRLLEVQLDGQTSVRTLDVAKLLLSELLRNILAHPERQSAEFADLKVLASMASLQAAMSSEDRDGTAV